LQIERSDLQKLFLPHPNPSPGKGLGWGKREIAFNL